VSRAFAHHELAARAWHALSPFPGERAIAARRFRELAHFDEPGHPMLGCTIHAADAEHVLQTIGELALEGFHAKAITAAVVRDRLQHIPSEAMAARVRALVAGMTHKMRGGPR
jgi:hypothetical protein